MLLYSFLGGILFCVILKTQSALEKGLAHPIFLMQVHWRGPICWIDKENPADCSLVPADVLCQTVQRYKFSTFLLIVLIGCTSHV